MRNQNGQGLVEYLILVCLVAVSTIAIVSIVGKNIQELYARVSFALGGEPKKIKTTRPGKETYRRRGMDNFDEGAETGDE